ncbi:MAG: methyltransferase domain-containing protein [Kiloniellales bacterium]|nr:methyltransferase domain-containing protein [Kiloniellales bacterium]
MPSRNAPQSSRAVALDLLEAVWQRGRPLEEAIAGHRGLDALAPRDRAFVRALAGTCLRRQGQIDALIDARLERPLKASKARVRSILRLGVAQVCFLSVPAHAAVSTTVALAQGQGERPFRGLINAVLRRLAETGAALAAEQDAARLNTPDWLWQSWSAAYGEAAARRCAEVQLGDPPLDLTLRRGEDPEAWAGRLDARVLPGRALRLAPGAGEVGRLPGYGEGAWWVQDFAAGLPVRLFGNLAGKTVLDLCAAPGGKTAQLAAAGAEVIALDLSESRLERLRGNLKRLGLVAATVVADAATWRPPQPAAAILLDAPCTATGTLRRHPDIARLRRPQDVAALTEVQDELLRAAAAMLAPGGTLVYAVCSLQPEEGPVRIDHLLEEVPELARQPLRAEEIHGLPELVTPDGDLRSLPCHLAELGGMDGFYACRLQRR